ncbi:general secretion pathway protein D [Desulfocicer vacuolatum DSM 3385]|uniref:General secretion pathway protein D n=1 Tax=Desulfocicer vacuolatum DSM 3385 TaxID=1121400 RepID=A0A1W1ZP43_9BACT|nr:SPOR domain-containing protein [Desulfocicer vacuolatum]SMC50023.1 general secretion pathway protein D [Desulfocicer vacuolatum DSM 3385]
MNRSKILKNALLAVMVLWHVVLNQGCVATDFSGGKKLGSPESMDPDSMVAWYTEALEKKPDDPELLFQLKQSRQKASMTHLHTAEVLIKKKFLREAITELQMAIAFYPANTRAVELISRVKKMRASEYHTDKAEAWVKQGEFSKALEAFSRAVELEPDNQQAKNALLQYKKKERSPSLYHLDLRIDTPVSLKFKKTPLMNVFEILSKISGINFIFDKDVRENSVTLFMTDVKIDKFIQVLLQTSDLKARSVNGNTLLIYPDTLAKAKDYDDLFVKTFYLSHLTSKDAVAIISKIFKIKDIVANEALNAITVRGKKAEIDMAWKIIQSNDLPPSEVVLNVEIIEVSRSKEKNLGLSFSNSITLGVSETSDGIKYYEESNFGFAGLGSVEDIGNITSKELYLSLPTATLNLLKQDADTRILAKPQIRVQNHGKAAILIGERIPLRSNRRIQTDGSTTYDYQYQDVGLKFNAEPIITMNNGVNLKLILEISSLGNNVGEVDDPQYAIRTKSASTVLTINDGDTVILGGLIQDEDRETVKKIPLLGDIPAMGRLFSNRSNENVETDILMTITPVVIRSQEMPGKEVTSFWSGSEKKSSNVPPFGQKDGEGIVSDDSLSSDIFKDMQNGVFLSHNLSFTIQVNAFETKAEAQSRALALEKKNYRTFVRKVDVAGKGTYYRVFVGEFPNFMDADQAAFEMRSDENFAGDIFAVDRAYVYGE